MSKYSGLFLSFLLIFICLWINICRYPQVWKMANGGDPPFSGEEKSEEAVPNEDTLETRYFSSPEEEWPKPVVITSAATEEKDLAAEETAAKETKEAKEEVPAQNVSTEADLAVFQNPYIVQEASIEKSKSDQAPAAAEESAAPAEPEIPAGETKQKPEGGAELSSVQVHSSYMAAEFPGESSRLNSDSPSYDVK